MEQPTETEPPPEENLTDLVEDDLGHDPDEGDVNESIEEKRDRLIVAIPSDFGRSGQHEQLVETCLLLEGYGMSLTEAVGVVERTYWAGAQDMGA